MSARHSALAPFRVRNFRLQYPADLAACWGFEMETLMLGWYILIETQSVLMLTVFGSLQYVGTLTAPVFGMAGDRIGPQKLLYIMRGWYAVLACILMTLSFTHLLEPMHVLIIAGLMSLARSSDVAVRSASVAETMPPRLLVRAMGVARTTVDSARILGSLLGAAVMAVLGMGPAYAIVAALYVTSLVLVVASGGGGRMQRATAARASARAAHDARSPLGDLRDGFAHVWATPCLLAAMCIAFLVNLTAFPLMNNLMPYVAKEIYGTDQRGLGYLMAAVGMGSLCGSLLLTRIGGSLRLARMILTFSLAWHLCLLAFSQTQNMTVGFFLLIVSGFLQSMTTLPLATMLLRVAEPAYRGRVMGIRMFAIYALPIGLLVSGPLIHSLGYPVAGALYCLVGLVATVGIAWHWRAHLWSASAPANRIAVRA